MGVLTAGQDWPSPDKVGDPNTAPGPPVTTAAGAGAAAITASKPCVGLDGESADGRRREVGKAAYLPVLSAASCDWRTL